MHPTVSRRQWLARCGLGFGSLAASTLLADEARRSDPLAPKAAHFAGKARRVIHVFLEGAPSHLDTFDPKPALAKLAGKPLPGHDGGLALPSPFEFKKYGRSGVEISTAFPHLAKLADDLCVVRSMHTDDPNHETAMLMMNTGDARFSRPSVGSWVTYGLGSENRNLPGFVVLYDNDQPLQGALNWRSAFLPGAYAGTGVNTKARRPEELIEHAASPHASAAEQRQQLDLLAAMNRRHADRRGDERLEARLQSFELAYRMQSEAADAFDVRQEPRQVRELYGNTPQGRQCLVARRLVERGVRFVQLYQGGWDHHEDIAEGLPARAGDIDRPLAALLTDLKRTGLLADTLVVVGGEFGRTPTADGNGVADKKAGRDHNHKAFSVLLAGAGVRAGTVYGATDEFGLAAVEDKVHVHDLHATVLHLLGFDHERLTYRYAGRDFRLTDVRGEVVKGVLS